MSDLNLDASISPDGVTLYKYLWVYLDHFTKKVNLAPLKRKCAEEVTEVLLDIFCDAGPPHILHSDNGREFKNEILFSTLSEKCPTLKIIHGKLRHPESQGAVERANRNIKDALFTAMHDKSNDQCWVKYLRLCSSTKTSATIQQFGYLPMRPCIIKTHLSTSLVSEFHMSIGTK